MGDEYGGFGIGITPRPGQEAEPVYQFIRGGSFILDTDPDPQPIWGTGSEVLQADGESLVIAGRQGLGKTALTQQLVLGRCGFEEYSTLLGFPIVPGNGPVLYLAMDRPRQIARSFRRMVGEAWRAELDERLVVWPGPPPQDLAQYPALLTRLSQQARADTVVVDSMKDAAVGLSDDEVGARYNRARQLALVEGVQVIEPHHLRKAPSAKAGAPIDLDDLYGSTWLTAGAGSVILLTGNPGDPIVGLQHLKKPNETVGPFKIIHHWETGRSTLWHAADLVLLARQPAGITAADAARAMYDTDKPEPNEKEKARRRLESLARSGLLEVIDQGDQAANKPRRWGAR
jgi:hypothetical protein